MKKFSLKLLSILLCIFTAALFCLAMTQSPAQADQENFKTVYVVKQLNELRDTLSYNWSCVLKHGWDAYAIMDEANGLKKIEAPLLSLDKLFAESSENERAELKRLIQTVRQISFAEKKLSESIIQGRLAALKPNLEVSSEMSQIAEIVSRKTSPLVFGPEAVKARPNKRKVDHEDWERYKKWYEEKAGYSNHEEKSETDIRSLFSEMEGHSPSPEKVEAPEEKPQVSDATQLLRAAFQAEKYVSNFNYLLLSTSYKIQEAMYIEEWAAPTYVQPDQDTQKKALNIIQNLSGLTEFEKERVARIPQVFQKSLESTASFDKRLKQKKQDQADLEQIVESALSQIDEMRSYYLNRIAEK